MTDKLFCLSCQQIFNHGIRYEAHFKANKDCVRVDPDNFLPQLFIYYSALLEACQGKLYPNCNFEAYKFHQFSSSIYPVSLDNPNFTDYILDIASRHQNCSSPVLPHHYDAIANKYYENSLPMIYARKLFDHHEYLGRVEYNRSIMFSQKSAIIL